MHLVDFRSGNGTTVRHADATTTKLVPRQPVALREGDVLHLRGDRVDEGPQALRPRTGTGWIRPDSASAEFPR